MQVLNPEGIWHSTRYHSAVRAGNHIYVAGRVPVDIDGNVVAPNDAAAQTAKIMEDLTLILAEGGATLQNIVSIHTYALYSEDMPAIFGVLHRYLGDHRPPHTGIRMQMDLWVQNGTRLEIEVVAVVEDS
jgi:2-iminobutanoate/2-iminopropanoate deaminase